MRILSRALGLGLLVAVAFPAAAADAASRQTPQPYHLSSAAGHAPLQLSGWRGSDERHAGRHDRRGPGGSQFGRGHGHGFGHSYGPVRYLPGWVVEQRLRRQSYRPVGRITLRHGVYLVQAIDPRGRPVLLALDPATAAILGRHRRW